MVFCHEMDKRCVNSSRDSTTRVYRVREEAGKDPVALMKFEFDGAACAVSGNRNRVMVETGRRLEIHDISKDASKLVCRIDRSDYISACALNEDGSEAAFFNSVDELQILEVGKANGSAMDQSAIVTVKVSESVGWICGLVYSDRGKLHAHHNEGKVSLFDQSTKELILLEAPQEGQKVVDWAISPNADYIALIKYVDKKEENGKEMHICRTIVKRKCKDSDWRDLFGYENPRRCATASAVLPEKATLTQARDALSHSLPAPLTRLTTIPVKEGSLCAFDGSLRHRYVLDDDLVIHRETINSDDDRGSVKLPAAVFKGDPHYLQTNSDGTAFYLATRMNKKHYIYVIDVARKRVYEHYLEHLESDIVEVRAHLDDKILEVILQDQVVLIFSWESPKTPPAQQIDRRRKTSRCQPIHCCV